MEILQFLLILGLVLLNGYFVASEFSLVAIRKTRIEVLVRKGNPTAKLVKKALQDLDTYISATQLGITLASLGLGWLGEPTVANFLEPYFSFLPPEAAFFTSHTAAVIIAFTIITFLHIVLGELAPKSIALQRSEATTLVVITPLIFFTKLFLPFIWILNGAGQLVLKVFGLHAPSGHQLVHSEEEIKMILLQSAKGGAIETQEAEMANRIFHIADMPIKEIMLPIRKIASLPASITIQAAAEKMQKFSYSRFPVFYSLKQKRIIGFMHTKDILRKLTAGEENITIQKAKIIRPLIRFKERLRVDDALRQMKKERIHIALVKNKNGKVIGMVTLEDIIEKVIGDIRDEFETQKNNL